jgi:nucleoside-triphosphatase
MSNRLFILSAPVRSGKTTALNNFSKGKNCMGFLTPDINARRVLQDVETGKAVPFEATGDVGNVGTQSIGKYTFYQSAFDEGSRIISHALSRKPDWLIIDEIGPLELQGKGFHDILQTVLPQYTRSGGTGNLVLVIRDSLLKQVCEHYQIVDYQLLDPEIIP